MSKTTDSQQTGRRAEALAEQYLARHGLRTLARNFHARGGEIDLVMQDHDTLVFVEVRYRSSPTHGDGVASVDARKRERIIHAAQSYLQRSRGPEPPCRFDVIGISPGRDPRKARVQWVQDAFGA